MNTMKQKDVGNLLFATVIFGHINYEGHYQQELSCYYELQQEVKIANIYKTIVEVQTYFIHIYIYIHIYLHSCKKEF